MTQETTSYNLNGMGIPYHIHNGVDSPMISPQSIGTGKIFNDISSSNYSVGVAGWKLSWGGDLEANSVTLTGGTIKYGKTSFTDSTHAGYYISSSGMYFGSASDAAYLKYAIGTGILDLSGGTIQTAATGLRLKMYVSGGDGVLELLDGNSVCGSLNVYWEDGGVGNDITGYNLLGGGGAYVSGYGRDNQGFSAIGATIDANNDAYVGVSWAGGAFSSVAFTLSKTVGGATSTLPISSNLIPAADSTYDLGVSSSIAWRTLYVDSITLNGDNKSAWPAAGTTVLSGLTIDTGKAWGGYNITALGNITPNGSLTYSVGSSSYYWEYVYLHIMEFWSYSTDPSTRTYGDMWHHYESGAGPKNFRGCPWNKDIYTFDMTAV